MSDDELREMYPVHFYYGLGPDGFGETERPKYWFTLELESSHPATSMPEEGE